MTLAEPWGKGLLANGLGGLGFVGRVLTRARLLPRTALQGIWRGRERRHGMMWLPRMLRKARLSTP